MEMLVVFGLFVVLAILGPVIGADSRVPGGWAPTEPGGKIWPDPLRKPDRQTETQTRPMPSKHQ
jgi:hypothetical protein